MLKRILTGSIIIFSTFISHLQAGDCLYLQDMAIRCIQRELSYDEMMQFTHCEDTASTKESFANYVMGLDEFISRVDLILRMQILQGTTSADVQQAIQDFDLIAFSQPEHSEPVNKELDRLYKLYRLKDQYLAGNTSIEQLYITNFDNWIYDQQNMGIDNFINSTFLYGMGRTPTRSEFHNAYEILNGKRSKLMYTWGTSREDYFKILTSNYNFIEKQVDFWYYYFLFSYPDKDETYQILKDILASGETLDLNAVIRYIIVNKLSS